MSKYITFLFLIMLISCGQTKWDKSERIKVSDYIKVTSPLPFQEVSNKLKIKGEAKGTYFFEANFPLDLVLENGEIVSHYATAKSDWMTENFVPFEAEIDLSQIEPQKAELKFKRANPSDLPENDMVLTIPLIITD